MASGYIQVQLGYRNFFIWVLISAIPVLILSRLIPMQAKEKQQDGLDETFLEETL